MIGARYTSSDVTEVRRGVRRDDSRTASEFLHTAARGCYVIAAARSEVFDVGKEGERKIERERTRTKDDGERRRNSLTC